MSPADRGRLLLGLAAVAVAFAAADTYVVVLALPDMMGAAGLSADQLQRAAPIVSGFLLGYVAVLPLVGRLADLRGRLPVLVGSLVVFAVGSLVTAAAYDLPSMVSGRFLQGVGGGGLVPATLALVADIYPAERRGLPLGVVGAVQEVGSVLGPLYGALVLTVASWRGIFWLNLAAGLVLAALVQAVSDRPGHRRRTDLLTLALLLLGMTGVLLVMLQPEALTSGVTTGLAFLPLLGGSRWLSPLGASVAVLAGLAVGRCLTARDPLVDLRSWRDTAREVDVPGATLLGLSLAGIIVAFATADPEVQVLAPAGPWLLAASAVAAAAFWVQSRRARHPLVPHGALRQVPAWGALVVSFLVGAALIAALVDIPVLARITVHPDSQLDAALVLVRFLVALPVGAVLGGWLTSRLPSGVVTAGGMALSSAGFWWMAQWDVDALRHLVATVPLALTGLGFGLALAPVNAALLAATDAAAHGVASALLVVTRMVGMLVGLSVLTTVGLRRFYAEQGDLPSPMAVCGAGISRCAEYDLVLREAGVAQLQTIFLGAAVCAALAGVLALCLLPLTTRRPAPDAGSTRPF